MFSKLLKGKTQVSIKYKFSIGTGIGVFCWKNGIVESSLNV